MGYFPHSPEGQDMNSTHHHDGSQQRGPPGKSLPENMLCVPPSCLEMQEQIDGGHTTRVRTAPTAAVGTTPEV